MTNSAGSLLSLLPIEKIYEARNRLQNIAKVTPLWHHPVLSEKYDCHLSLKREDLQVVRSYKIRGAYNKLASMSEKEQANGIVCASAGNHAQGVALACHSLQVNGRIFMPETTPRQKIEKVKFFGKEWIEIILSGDTFDDAQKEAQQFCRDHSNTFLHPFDDLEVIAGQATVGLEILHDSDRPIDYLLVPIGGGGLAAGVGSLFRQISPNTKIIGVEPTGAAAMYHSLAAGKNINLKKIRS